MAKLARNGHIYGSLLMFTGKLFNSLSVYISLLIVSHILDKESFGTFSFFMSLILYSVIFSKAGCENIMLKLLPTLEEKLNGEYLNIVYNILFLFLLSSIVILFVLLGGSNFIDDVVNIYNYKEILWIMAWVIPFQASLVIYRAINQVEYNFFQAVIPENFLRPFIFLVLTMIFYLFHVNNLKLISLAYLLSFIIASVYAFLYRRDLIKLHSLRKFTFEREVYKLSGEFTPIQILNQSSNFLPIFIMGIYLTSSDIGIFNIAQQTTLLISFMLTSINLVFAPTISQFHSQKKFKELKGFYEETTRWILTIGGFLSILLILNSNFIMRLFGDGYVNYGYILIVLAFGQLINASTGSSGYLLLMTGNQKLMLKFTLIQVIISVIMTILLVNQFGLFGGALSFALGMVIINILQVIYVNKKLGINPFTKRYAVIVSLLFVTCAIGMAIKTAFEGVRFDFSSLILFNLSILTFFILCFYAVGIDKNDKKGLLKQLTNKIKS